MPRRVFKSSAKDSAHRPGGIKLRGSRPRLIRCGARPISRAHRGIRPYSGSGGAAGTGAAHVPYWWVNNPTLGEFCFTMIGRADIEGSKSNVAMNAWLPQASYPCGNFSDTSSFKLRRSKGSIGHAFTMCRPSQTPHLTMSSARIDRPKPPWFQKEGKLPASASRNNRIPLVRTSSESAVRRPGKAPEGAVPGPSPGRHAATRSRRGAARAVRRQPTGSGPGPPGCSPWRPDAVMSTTGAWTALGPPDFQGPPGAHRTPRDVRCSSGRWTLPPAEPFPGWAGR
ncbi:hypothetical protein LUZ60_017871 [Juncus effusus]|nr:hypothetical protein LUZ60_017871 [Juncus effusus]